MARSLKKLVAALSLAGLCASANADPVTAAVAAIGSAMGGAAGAYMIMNAAAVAMGALKLGAMVALGMKQRQKAKREARRQRDAYNASLQDRNTMVAEASPEVKHIYGRATVGGAVAAIFTRGNKDQYKDVVIMWAGHECDAIEDVQIAGESIELGENGFANAEKWLDTANTTHYVNSQISATGELALPPGRHKLIGITFDGGDFQRTLNNYTITGDTLQVDAAEVSWWQGLLVTISYQIQMVASQVSMRHYLGSEDQAADAALIASTAGKPGAWTASDRLRGICYSIVTLDLNNSELQGGLPQITATIRGKKVLDPRTDTTAWSENSALCIYDFLRNAEYGKGVLAEQVEGVVTAANACDELITVDDGGQQITAKRYTCNGAWHSGTDPDDVLEDLANSMGGYVIPGGTWAVQAGVYGMPVLTLGDDQAAGPISMIPAPSRADSWNGVKGQYIDPAQYNQAVDYEPLQSEAYVEDDGGEVWGSVELAVHGQRMESANSCCNCPGEKPHKANCVARHLGMSTRKGRQQSHREQQFAGTGGANLPRHKARL